jgi:hypothetical protein
VHPALEYRPVGAFRGDDSNQAHLRHPGPTRLGLLPSGPDPIHSAPPRRTRLSTSSTPGAARQTSTLGRGIRPRIRGFREEGTPSAPLSTVDAMVVLRRMLHAAGRGAVGPLDSVPSAARHSPAAACLRGPGWENLHCVVRVGSRVRVGEPGYGRSWFARGGRGI